MTTPSASHSQPETTPRLNPLNLQHDSQPLDQPPSPKFLLPSPLPTRRTRTYSETARATAGPTFHGICKSFCRSKGHGFIRPAEGTEDIFVHISDIEGEYVPTEGDDVTYKLCSIPPKHKKVQAVEVNIIHLAPDTLHETWTGRATPH
uniref:Cold shock domain containing C2, RNA binding a n=1 Tax=Eptatretus burgeri TaxID=7764 RepID=A0A8C4QA55_EPTBU